LNNLPGIFVAGSAVASPSGDLMATAPIGRDYRPVCSVDINNSRLPADSKDLGIGHPDLKNNNNTD